MSHEDAKEKRARELHEAKAARKKVDEQIDLDREILVLELEERFAKELGREGVDFAIVHPTPEGPIVVKLGAAVLHKQFMAAFEGKEVPTPEAQHAYVSPCVVYPEPEKFAEIVARRPALRTRCASALSALHGGKVSTTEGKF